jgi:hypothetical protein
MTEQPRRDWTQYDIVEEVQRRHTGPGFFNVLSDVCEEAFGGKLDTDGEWEFSSDQDGWPANWHEFDVEDLTVGRLIDFFAERGRMVPIKWHNQGSGPGAYVVIDDRDLAADFCLEFGRAWATEEERNARRDEDTVRASGLK